MSGTLQCSSASIELAGFTVQLADEPVDSHERQWLTRVRGVGKRLLGRGTGLGQGAVCMMVPGPEEGTFRPAEDGPRPVEPAIVRFEPGTGGGEIVRIKSRGHGDAFKIWLSRNMV